MTGQTGQWRVEFWQNDQGGPVVADPSTILRRNLAENPNGNSVADTDINTPIARTNLSESPNFSAGAMEQQDGSFTITDNNVGTSDDMDGVEYRQAVIDTPNTVEPIWFTDELVANTASVTVGESYTFSCYFLESDQSMYDARIDVVWLDGGGTPVQTDTGLEGVLTSNVWRRLSETLVAPVGSVTVQVRAVFVDFLGGIANEFVRVGGLLIEEVNVLKPLIVGDISLDPALDSSFSGADYDSTTEAFATGVPYPLSDSPLRMDATFAGGSGGHSEIRQALLAGDNGIAVIPDDGDPSTDSYWNATDPAGGVTYFDPDRIYRVSGEITLLDSQDSSGGDSRDRGISIITNTGGSENITFQSPSAPNAAGTTRVGVTFTVPSDVTQSYMRLYNGSSDIEETVYWDKILVEDVTGGVPEDDSYFDGSTLGGVGGFYEWEGTPDASTSVKIAAEFISSYLNFDELGCLNAPPSGLGHPPLRESNQAKVQRDGVTFYGDWYESRSVEFTMTFKNDGCPGCPGVRQKVAQVMRSWNRNCSEASLLLIADCTPETDVFPNDVLPDAEDRATLGPYIVTGRPREANIRWERSDTGVGHIDFRFDSIDERIGIVRPNTGDGTITSETCVTLATSGASAFVENAGDLETCLDITYEGVLTEPIELDFMGFGGGSFILNESVASGETVTVNTCDRIVVSSTSGLIPQNTVNVDPFTLGPGFDGTVELSTGDANDSGTVTVCWSQDVIGI